MSKCRKVRYATRLGAMLAMSRISSADKRSLTKHEQRIYRCPHCRGFHLTSQTYRGEGTWRP